MNTRAKACRIVCPEHSRAFRMSCRTARNRQGWTCKRHDEQEQIEERKRLERKGK